MNNSQKEVYLVVTAAFLGYSLGKVFDSIILLASPNPKPILEVFLLQKNMEFMYLTEFCGEKEGKYLIRLSIDVQKESRPMELVK